MGESFIIRRGGGGLPVNGAVIHVVAPTGSTVAFSKGAVVVKTLAAGKGHTNTDGENADYYFAVLPLNYGEWTVTASKDGETDATKTITVNENKQYDVELSYKLWLYKDGDERTETTTGWESAGYSSGPQGWGGNPPIITKFPEYAVVQFNGNSGGCYTTKGQIDLTSYNTMRAIVRHESGWGGDSYFRFGVRATKSDSRWLPEVFTNLLSAGIGNVTGQDIEISLNITGVTGLNFCGFYSYNSTGNRIDYLRRVWCER